MQFSSDDTTGSQYIRLEVQPSEQGVAYTPGDGTVLFLNDKTTEQAFFDALTYTQRMVLATRLRAWADMASYTGDEFKNEDDR